MRISRMSMAVVTGALVIVVWVGAGILLDALLPGFRDQRFPGAIAFGVGVAVLWLADRFELMAPSQTPPVVDLYGKDEPDEREPPA